MTVVTYMNATGIYVPTLLVFPRSNMKAELLDGAPPGSIAACQLLHTIKLLDWLVKLT